MARTVAIKLLLDPTPASMVRLERESLVTARLQHPAIVPIYDHGRLPDGQCFYAMKLVRGRSLREEIAARPTLRERLELLPHVLAVVDAMSYAHEEGVLHRDLKPSNVLVGPFGETMIIDWGLAKEVAYPEDDVRVVGGAASDAALTRDGAVLGTPAYMAPEQARGEGVDARADVYALGAILHHLVAGVPPYTGACADDVVRQVLAGPPAPLASRRTGVPEDLATLIATAMARDPARRYSSARALGEDLRRFQEGRLVRVHRYSLRSRFGRFLQRHRALAAMAMAALALVTATAVVALYRVLRARDRTDAALRLAEQRADELTLAHARHWLDADPTAALAWLRQLRSESSAWPEARAIAAEASSRGVARHVLALDGVVTQLAPLPDGGMVASGLIGGTDRIEPGRVRRERWLRHAALTTALAVSGRSSIAVGDATGTIHLRSADGTVRLWQAHQGPLYQLAFAEGSARLYSAGRDGAVRVWSLEPGAAQAPARTLVVGRAAVNAIVLLDDERTVIAATEDGRLVRLDVMADALAEVAHVQGPLLQVSRAPGGAMAAAVGEDGRVRLVGRTGPPRVLDGARGRLVDVAFASGGRVVVAGGDDGRLWAWTCATGMGRPLVKLDTEVRVVAAAGERVAAGGADGTVARCTVDGDCEVLRGHRGPVRALAFTGDGTLVSAGGDRTARIWAAPATGTRARPYLNPIVYALRSAPDGQRWLMASHDHRLRLFDAARDTWTEFAGHRGPVHQARFSPDGARIASASLDGTVRLWEGSAVRVIEQDGAVPIDIAFSRDGQQLAIARSDGRIGLCDTHDGSVRVLPSHDGEVRAVLFDDRGALVSAGGDGRVLCRRPDGTGGEFLQARSALYALAASPGTFSESGSESGSGSGPCPWVAAAAADGGVWVWRGGAGERLVAPGLVRALAITPQTVMAITEREGIVSWGRSDLRRHDLDPTAGPQRSLAISSSGRWAATAGEDGAVHAWDLEGNRRIIVHRHAGGAHAVAISADGTRVASVGADAQLRMSLIEADRSPPADPSLRAWIAARTTAEPRLAGPPLSAE